MYTKNTDIKLNEYYGFIYITTNNINLRSIIIANIAMPKIIPSQQPLENVYISAKQFIANIPNKISFFMKPFSSKIRAAIIGITSIKYSPKTLGFSNVEYALIRISSNLSSSIQACEYTSPNLY